MRSLLQWTVSQTKGAGDLARAAKRMHERRRTWASLQALVPRYTTMSEGRAQNCESGRQHGHHRRGFHRVSTVSERRNVETNKSETTQ
eukprot:3018767-Pleurochrysis_carterae.AAC.2